MYYDKIKYDLIDNIMSYFKYEFMDILDNHKLPIFNNVLKIMHDNNNNNDYHYYYTLKDIDNNLFNELIHEVIKELSNNTLK